MIAPALDRAVLSGRLAQIAQLVGTYDSKTDQTAQSDQRVGNAGEFGAPLDQKLTSRDPKSTSETAQQPNAGVQTVGAPADFIHGCRSDGAPCQ
jgi:hypothetical protein